MSIADLGGTNIDLRFFSSKGGHLDKDKTSFASLYNEETGYARKQLSSPMLVLCSKLHKYRSKPSLDPFSFSIHESDNVWTKIATIANIVKLVAETVTSVAEIASRQTNKVIWKVRMPSKVKIFAWKVKIFAWRLLKDRLPTRLQLLRRDIIAGNEECLCVFGCPIKEDANHLFLRCVKLRRVWEKIQILLEIFVTDGDDCSSNYLNWFEALHKKIPARRAGVFWTVVCWCIWKQRNDMVFNNAVEDVEEIVHNIKMHLWWWMAIGNNRE
ncbi:uncharacterized protein LOC131624988 [Vicia villosa]|uniref:uncharacterized protein LOC131624988 n=1 Tax=Vicia villosa TaxID=3911 RepID=UPI00273C9197|nr:uncharacterized protein LOC131624988 [Vicia villosa]